MSYDFNDESKAVKEFGDYLGFGVHKVKLMLATAGETDAGKPFIEVDFVTDDGLEDKARVWFVSDANANISFNTLRQMLVHNTEEAHKDKARDAVDAVKDIDELATLLNEKMMGGEFWVTKYYDPSRTYQNQSGATKRSINTNMYGYEPKPRPDLMPKPADENGDPVDSKVTDAFPGAEKADTDAAGGIPSKW